MLFLRFVTAMMVVISVGGKVISTEAEWNGCCRDCDKCPWKWLDEDGYKPICQYYANEGHYVTLYDTVNKIPIFSCFRLDGESKEVSRQGFAVEPQLIDLNASPNMEQVLPPDLKDKLGEHQATDEDYIKANFESRGHLNPAQGHSTADASRATFTLTNCVPQMESFNNGCWHHAETALLKYVKQSCNEANINIVGAIPGEVRKVNNRVNVPDYLWSTTKCKENVVAFLAPNEGDSDIKKDGKMTVFYFKADLLDQFTNKINGMYKKGDLKKKVKELKEDKQYTKNALPTEITKHKKLNECLPKKLTTTPGYDEL